MTTTVRDPMSTSISALDRHKDSLLFGLVPLRIHANGEMFFSAENPELSKLGACQTIVLHASPAVINIAVSNFGFLVQLNSFVVVVAILFQPSDDFNLWFNDWLLSGYDLRTWRGVNCHVSSIKASQRSLDEWFVTVHALSSAKVSVQPVER